MPILATNIQKARHPMPPITVTLLVDGEERTETIRFNRATRSPAKREEFQQTLEETAPDKEELVRLLLACEVQSPDIVDAEQKPYPLDAEYLSGLDYAVLLAIWNSLLESLRPNATTSTSTNSG